MYSTSMLTMGVIYRLNREKGVLVAVIKQYGGK